MDFSNLKGKIFYNNKFISSKSAKIHVLNHSLHFASSVFEGIRVYNSEPLFLGEHIKRLKQSSKIMRLNFKYKQFQIEKIIKKLIKINKLKDGYIRPIIFRSSHSMSPETHMCKTIIAIACWKWEKLFNNDRGITMNVSKYPRLNKKIYPIEAKSSGSYQTSVISRVDARKKKYDDSLMLDLKGNIAESSACNIFWIKRNIVFTSNEHSILNGITRKAVIKLCRINKIKIKIGDYKISSLLNSDSIFLTGTAAEIQSVRKILNKNFTIKSKIVNKLKIEYDKLKKYCPSKINNIK